MEKWRRGWDLNPRPLDGDGLAAPGLAGPRLGPTRPPRLGSATTMVLNFSLVSTFNSSYAAA
jgi:hypothetical protein